MICRVTHTCTQDEEIQALETELESLLEKRQKLEDFMVESMDSAVTLIGANLSEKEINDKLKQVRETPSDGRLEQDIHQAHNEVLSKQTKIAEAKSYLETMRSELSKLGDELKDLIMQKDRTVTQVIV